MTATLTAAPVAARRATVALARVEAVRLLRHPVTVLATLCLIGFWVAAWFTNDANRYPVLQDVDRDSDLGVLLLIGAAALIAGNYAVLRAHRDGTTGLAQVLVLPRRARTLAHLLAVLPLAVAAGVLIVARIAVLALVTPAAGQANPYEVAIGPATVLLLGALGVLTARLTRSPVVAPLVLLVLLASLVVLPLLANGGTARWLQPVVGDGGPAFTGPAPAYLMARPAAAHVAYLLGLAGLCAVAALVMAGARGARVLVAAALAVCCAVVGGVGQLRPVGPAVTAARVDAMNHPATHETCRTLDGVDYCAFTDFVAWIPAWHDVARAVVAAVPTDQRPAPLTIRQRIVVLDSHGAAVSTVDDPAAVTAGTRWGDSQAEASFAASVAYRLVTGRGAGFGSTACGGAGVLVVWLVGRTGAHLDAGLRQLVASQHGQDHGLSFGQGGPPDVTVPGPEVAVALEALRQPVADIAARVQRSWVELTAPGTTAAEAAQLLGVAPPAAPAERCR